jgi:hypothetical protein
MAAQSGTMRAVQYDRYGGDAQGLKVCAYRAQSNSYRAHTYPLLARAWITDAPARALPCYAHQDGGHQHQPGRLEVPAGRRAARHAPEVPLHLR